MNSFRESMLIKLLGQYGSYGPEAIIEQSAIVPAVSKAGRTSLATCCLQLR